MGGSPCQGFSRNGKGLNFDDPRSKLFFEFVKAKEVLEPKYFLLENVNMKKEWQDVITSYLGVEPVKLNSGMFSAQERLRTYWTNIPLDDIEPINIDLSYYTLDDPEFGILPNSKIYDLPQEMKDISLETNNGYIIRNGTKYKGYLRANKYDGVDFSQPNSKSKKTGMYTRRGRVHKGKIGTLDTSCKWGLVDGTGRLRPLIIQECEMLQGLPSDYTKIAGSDGARKKIIGNGWQCDTIKYLFRNLPKHLNNVVSLFDGASMGQYSLVYSGYTIDKYYASEIDKKAIAVAMSNYPDTIQLGDVTKIDWTLF